MAARRSIAPFLLLLLISSAWAAGMPPVTNLEQPVSLAGQWKFSPGDDPAWALPGFDDSAWAAVVVPAVYPAGFRGFTGVGWYRLSVQLDKLK